MEEPYFIPGAVACGVAILLCFVAPWQCAPTGLWAFKPLRYYRYSTYDEISMFCLHSAKLVSISGGPRSVVLDDTGQEPQG